MAARGIALGRIIDWFRTCDTEEGHYALHRAGTILAERKSQLEPARARTAKAKKSHHKPKDTRTVAEVMERTTTTPPSTESDMKAASAS